MKFCQMAATLLLLGVITSVNAEEYTHKASGLSFELPKGWTCREKGDTLSIVNKDKSLSVTGGVIPQENATAIFGDIQKFLDKLDGLDDVKVTGGPKKEKVNGLEQAWYEGTASYTGEDKAEKIQWDMTIVSGGKSILFLVGIGKLDDNEETYEQLFESIEKAENAEH